MCSLLLGTVCFIVLCPVQERRSHTLSGSCLSEKTLGPSKCSDKGTPPRTRTVSGCRAQKHIDKSRHGVAIQRDLTHQQTKSLRQQNPRRTIEARIAMSTAPRLSTRLLIRHQEKFKVLVSRLLQALCANLAPACVEKPCRNLNHVSAMPVDACKALLHKLLRHPHPKMRLT